MDGIRARVTWVALHRAFLFIALFHLLGAAAQATPFEDRLRDEIGRLRQRVSLDRVEDDGQRRSLQGLLDRLGEVDAEIEAGRPYHALARLDAVRSDLEPLAYVLAASGIEKAGLEEFEAKWRAVGESLTAKEAAYRGAPPAAFPVAVQALAEAAQRQSRPYYLSSLGFAKESGNEAGLYYLGAARERLDFALFCRGLGLGTPGPPPALRPLGPSLERLEDDTGSAYAEPDAAIAHHSRFIALNSAIKEARELEADGLRYGALFKLLDARRRLEEIRALAEPPPPADSLRRLADSSRRQLESREGSADHSLGDHSLGDHSLGDHSLGDHSLGRLFLETAEASLDRGEIGDDDLRSAAAVLKIVLPEYFNLIEEPKP